MFSVLLIVSLVSLCLAQILSLHPQDDPFSNNALVEHTHPQHRQHRQHNHRYASPPQPGSDLLDNIDLLDIILLASVDGKFHALNRTSGHVLWSMGPYASSTSPSQGSDTPTATPSGPSPLSPLVRTDHIDYDPEITDDTTPQEMYIIEPQSGDIYVMPNPSSPLQRFPFTMQELVDMSPFSFDGDGEDDGRVFVGKKETSLLVVELETGRIKATLNSECPWDQFEEFRKGEGRDELDLDELDGSKPEKQPTTDVYIGRTDYHVSIITRPNPSSGSFRPSGGPSNLIQNLSFSTYGPNRQDHHMQSLYRHTKDNAYIQPLPSGEIMSFKAQATVDPSPLWALNFSQPIVAIFDVLRKKPTTTLLGGDKGVLTRNPHPFVLLQPRPKLQDLFPNLPSSMKQNLQMAYVGLVTETGSLFAMSPQNFPLVVFGRNDKRIRVIDSGSSSSGGKGWSGGEGSGRVRFGSGSAGGGSVEEEEEPTSVDELTKLRKLRGAGLAEPQDQNQEDEDDVIECHEKVMNDRRCLVGVRRMELNRGDGAETRMKRLLDASPSAMQYGEYQEYLGSHSPHPPDSVYSSGGRRNNNGEAGNESREPLITIDPPHDNMMHTGMVTGWRMWEAVCATIVLGFITFWVLTRGETWKKALGIKTSTLISPPTPAPSQPQPPLQLQPQTLEGKEEVRLDSNDASELITSTLKYELDIPPHATIPLTPSMSTHSQISIPTPATSSTPPTIIPDTLGSRTLTPIPATSGMSGTGTALGGEETDKEDMDGANTDVGEDDFVVVDGAGKPNGAAAPETNDSTPVPVTPKKKRTRRGGRGAKKPKNAAASGDAAQPNGSAKVEEVVEDTPTQTPPSSLVVTSTVKPVATPSPSLTVSDTVLGYGSHGTVVYKGSLQGRAVAVKRLLADFVTLASREVSILQESDDHPNVIRYYYQEAHAGFLYIALELCPASLADLIETPDRDAWREIAVNFDPKRALRQVTNGLRHLHGLKLVHRDIKPQNILVSVKTSGAGGEGGGSSTRGGNYRMLISDFGLCKKLEVDQSSFLPTAHGAMAAGTVGWRAPEILSGEVKLNEFADDQSQSSRGSTATVQGGASSISSTSSNSSANGKGRTRLTKSVDIFALGCLYYYTLTGGGHPFGDRYEREVNIMKNAKSLEVLERFGEEGTEAVDLIEKMLDPLPSGRPDTTSCLLHPFFWDSSRRLNFLQDASDRFEIMCRDPKDPNLLTLEDGAMGVVGNDWYSRLDKVFIENLGKFRKYDGRSVQDLLRALRNKKHHYQDLPDNVKRHLGPMPDGYLAYFTRRFPNLFLHVHRVVKETGLEDESMFRSYFELPDS